MRFLIKLAFWMTVVLVLLPSGGSQPAPKVNVSAGDAITAASAAMSDMKQFCGRQSDACAVGSQVAAVIGQRAQAGAKVLYEFLSDHVGTHDQAPAAAASGKAVPLPHAKPSQNTLTAGDLTPGWRGPQPTHREARATVRN
jgi:hypothetical protein